MDRTGELVGGIERRGSMYYMRMRVPARYRDVESRSEVNRSLKTRDLHRAQECFVALRRQLYAEWDARLAQKNCVERVQRYDTALDIMRAMSMPYRPMDDLIAGRLEELVERVQAIGTVPASSPRVDALLGAVEVPDVKVSALPAIIREVNAGMLKPMNDRQTRQWCQRYKRSAELFAGMFGDISVRAVTEQQAISYTEHWQNRCQDDGLSSNYANKNVRFMRQMIDAYFDRFKVPKSQRSNPFSGYSVEKPVEEEAESTLALPNPWIGRVVIRGEGLEGLNSQARAIAVVAAETGTRQTEVFDLPASDIHLDGPIPHMMLRIVAEGPDRRLLKNKASKRPVVLLGASLAAMRAHPNGFATYCGKATYPGTINKHMRDHRLFPKLPQGETRSYKMSGTSHSFEDRLKGAGIRNEERAYMMGHSVGKILGRPVYGSELDLRMRALLQEMVSFRTDDWTPRPTEDLWIEGKKLADELGFTFT
jgi:hypothetical protein